MTDVKIKQFRQILFWPLEIEKLSTCKGQQDIERLTSEFQAQFVKDGKWKRLHNLLSRVDSNLDKPANLVNRLSGQQLVPVDGEKEAEYAELMFFHPFVRRFLYGSDAKPGKANDKPKPAMRLFSRDDIKKCSVSLMVEDYHCSIHLAIDRIHFYLFDHGVALLVVELSAKNPLPLVQVQELLDRFRRAYPPYWETENREAGHCLQWVRWNNYSNPKGSHYYCTSHFRDFAVQHQTPLPFEHWQYLLLPLVPWQTGLRPEVFAYRQIEDERMPFMAYLSLEDPRQLSRSDFVRLCFGNESGHSTELPYAESFLNDFEANHCLDRFWDPSMRHVDSFYQNSPGENALSTRYLCSGNGFVMIGKDGPGSFTDGKNGGLAHFRRHYFQMGLIAHFQRTTLLLCSQALAEAAANVESHELNPRYEDIRVILERFHAFIHRVWFREVSSQTPGRELFSLLTKHLDNQALFDRVKQQVQDAQAFLVLQQQNRQTTTTTRLNVLATFGLATGLIGIFLAVDWSKFKGLQVSIPEKLDDIPIVGYVVILVVLGMLLVISKSVRLAEWLDKLSDPNLKFTLCIKQFYRWIVEKAKASFY
ncbi:MAG: hypothetical protein ACOYMG_18500 [Candidatus Methylumidiphilus sp.]